MLVLARALGQRICIRLPEGEVVVEVCKIDGGRVSLGISAPRSINVAREELVDRKEVARERGK
jgi:carbon storage regulator CsrA